MTPYEMQLLLHYHVRANEPDGYINDTELRGSTLSMLVGFGLLEPQLRGNDHTTAKYTTTEKAAVFIDAVLSTPLPEKQWVMPT